MTVSLPEGVKWVGPWRFVNDRTVTVPLWRRFVSELIPAPFHGGTFGWANCVTMTVGGEDDA